VARRLVPLLVFVLGALSVVAMGQPRTRDARSVRVATRATDAARTDVERGARTSTNEPSEPSDDRAEEVETPSEPSVGTGVGTSLGPTVGPSRSRSVGATNRGRLNHAVRVEPSSSLRVRNPSQAYGTEELVALITWAADEVARQHPGSSLNVGDLSRERGGRIRPHRSHRVGRDADLGFYLVDAQSGAPAEARHFVALPRGAKGTDRQGGSFAFDDARNWTLVAALVSQDVVPVQYIMVIAPLKERLLAEGRRRGASPELLARVDAVVGPQRSGRGRFSYDSHDSHFHVRIYCAPDDRPACVDTAPFHPWVSREAVETRQRARARRPARRPASRQARRR
jgi:penicillin-insensitive murein endopeptidase